MSRLVLTRKLFWRVRSSWKNAVTRRPRAGAPRFGYDLQSYSLNIEDGQHVPS
jgi:hypothetical protein